MGGTTGTPVGFTPQTSGLVQRGGGGISTLPVTSTPPTTIPAATPTPMPSVSPTMPSTGMVNRGLSSTPAASNKGGGLATTPSPTFASDPVVAQPLPPFLQRPIPLERLMNPAMTGDNFGPAYPISNPTNTTYGNPIPSSQQSNKGGGLGASPSQNVGLQSIPLAPYGNPTNTTGTRDITDVTELSRTNFDPELTSRDTLRRLDSIDKRFADQDAASAAAAANAPTPAERQAAEDRKFIEQRRRIQQAEASNGA